jgi:WD40 repeat protein
MPESPKRIGPAWHSTLLLAMLAGAGDGWVVGPPGDASSPAAETSPFLVRTFELQRRGRPLIGIDLNGHAHSIDPEWTRLAAPTKDGKVQLFDVASGEPAGTPLDGGFRGTPVFLGGPFNFTFTSDGRLLVWSYGKKVVVWRVDSREVLLKQEVDDLKAGVHVAPGGRFLAWSTDESTVVWDTSSRSVSARLEGRLCDFSPDGRLLALAGSLWDYEYARLLKKPVGGSIWDLERGQPLVEDIRGLCHGFSPDGRYVVVESTTGTALWDISGIQTLPAFRRLTDRVRRMIIDRPVWSANGRFLAFANGDFEVEVWDLEAVPPTHRILQERRIRHLGRAGSPWLLLSHDGGLLSDACWVTDLWDLSRPAPRRMLRTGLILGPPIITPVGGRPSVLSRDGRTLAYTWGSGSLLKDGDAGFGLWDVARGRAASPRIKVRDLARMQFSPDGRLLATSGWGPGAGGKDGPFVQLWSVDALRAAGEGEMSDGQPAAR